MPNRGKKWVIPGELSHQVQASNYLLKRKKTIKQNAEKLTSLGLQRIARAIGSAKGTNEKGKKNVIGNDKDENYIPTEDDDVDDETSWSKSDEPRDSRVKRARTIAAALNLAGVESTHEALPTTESLPTQHSTTQLSPTQPPTTQPLPTQLQSSQLPPSPHTAGSSVASTPPSSQSSHVRGVTRGKNATKLRRQLGHNILVLIPISSHRPEGEHTPLLVNHLGLAIREVAPVKPHGWKKLDSGIKLAVIAAVQIRADIDRQCGVLYKSWKYELHSHYLELLEQRVPRPQDHPASSCDLADWQLMISQCWESPAWKAKSKKAQESRAKLPYNRTSGSRSFASRMSMMDALVQQIEEQSQLSVTTLMNEEEIAVDVLGKRSGYLNGYGIYTRSSSSSTHSRASHSEVIALREQVAEQARRQAEQDERYRALEAIVQQLASVAGIDPTGLLDITRGTTSSGDGTTIGDHDATLGGGGAHLGT